MRKILVALCLIFSTSAWAAATDCSATTGPPNQPVTLFAAGVTWSTLILQNLDPNVALWYSFASTARSNTQGSFVLAPSQAKAFSSFSMIQITRPSGAPGLALTAVATNPNHVISCMYW